MIVIAGKYKGRHLKTLSGKNTRPTSARVKEDMFNILHNYFIFDNKVSLDLFGGSGALSIEGLSRGIKKAYINDHFGPALAIIKQNLKDIPSENYQLWQWDYTKILTHFGQQNKKVDLIYFDPPFAQTAYYENFFTKVEAFKLLNPWGVVVAESPQPLDLETISKQGLKLLKTKVFKNKYLYLWRKEGEE